MQWNIRGVFNNLENLRYFLDHCSPDILFLNETWFRASDPFTHKGYVIYREDRADGYGGIATFIKARISHNVIQVSNNLLPPQCHFQGFFLDQLELYIGNIYLHPNSKLIDTSWEHLINLLQRPFILMGDFNSQHYLWGSNFCNRNGNIIANCCETKNIIVLNDGSSTRLNRPNQNRSILDLTLVTQSIASKCEWFRMEDVGHSDHYPTCCSFYHDIVPYHCSNHLRRHNFKNADWTNFNDKFTHLISYQNPNSYSDFINILEEASEGTIPIIKSSKGKKGKTPIWWDDECSLAIKQRKDAIKFFNLNVCVENYIQAKNKIAVSKRVLKTKRKEHFRKFCSSLNRNTPIAKVWRSIRTMRDNAAGVGGFNKLPTPRVALLILDILTPPILNFSPPEAIIVEDFKPFTMCELNTTLTNKKDTAVGLDNISYSMISHLPYSGKEWLLNFLNQCLHLGEIPMDWRNTVVHPILKKDKDARDGRSYRPISLLSCVRKVFEYLIKSRIEWLSEEKEILHPSQMGFRKGRGCMEAVTHLVSEIQIAFSKKQMVLAVFLDLKNAYDCVEVNILANCLKELNIPGYYINVIVRLLIDKVIRIKDNGGNYTSCKNSSQGLAQGSPLSPILFNIYTRSMFQIITQNTQIIQYADDIVLYLAGDNLQSLVSVMNRQLRAFEVWLENHNFKVSTDKCKAMLFHSPFNKVGDNKGRILYNDSQISWTNSFKYLGVCLSDKLCWKSQVNDMVRRAESGLNVMRALCGTWWGADPLILSLMYKGIVRSHLEYGGFILTPYNQQNLKKLDIVQYKALRILSGTMRSTPIVALLAECGEINLESRRKIAALKFTLKILSMSSSPLRELILDQAVLCRQFKFWKNRSPYVVQALERVRDIKDRIYQSNFPPCYILDIECLLFPIKLVKMDPNSFNISQELKTIVEEYFQGFSCFYTDGSIDQASGKGGFGICCPELDISYSSRMLDNMTICTIELIAIFQALELAIEKDVKNILIVSDSLSALQKIASSSFKDIDCVTASIKKVIYEFRSQFRINFLWCPSHRGIKGNEKADQLAKIGRDLNVPYRCRVDRLEFFPFYKREIIKEFLREWKQTLSFKGSFYREIQSEFSFKPWYYKLPYQDRRHISTIIRMRTGHGLYPQHMFKINLKDSPLCDCGEVGSLSHMLFECPLTFVLNFDPYQSIQSFMEEQGPLSIETILGSPNINVVKVINDFLRLNNLKI